MKILKWIPLSILGIGLCLNLVGCGSESEESKIEEAQGNNNQVNTEDKEVKDLVLKDFGYFLSSGYVEYALEIENPNDSFSPQFINVDITGKNKDGTIAFTDNWVISPAPANSTTYWASQAGNGNVDESVEVTAKVSVKDSDWVKSDPVGEIYKIDNVSTKENSLGGQDITGEITVLNENDVDGHSILSPMIVAVFKNEEGKLLGGTSTFYSGELVKDEPSAFEISCYGFDPSGKTTEVYANPWY